MQPEGRINIQILGVKRLSIFTSYGLHLSVVKYCLLIFYKNLKLEIKMELNEFLEAPAP